MTLRCCRRKSTRDFGIKVEDVETPIYNKDSKEIFAKIQSELNDMVLGQTEAVKDLVIGFRRPFVVGIDPKKTRNTILLTGPNGTGRHMMVNKMSMLMKKYELQHASSVWSYRYGQIPVIIPGKYLPAGPLCCCQRGA